MATPAPLLAVVSLFVKPGRERELREFETRASAILRRHGGRIERAIRPTRGAGLDPLPHEIHVLSFPSEEELAAYQRDPDLEALAPLRELAIAHTTVVMGGEAPPYS